MKESKKLNKLIIMLLLIVCPAVASEPASDLTIANEQIALLKQQVAMMKEHQESLLGTIHWTLGTVITVGIFLIGYNWFSNFKAYERDKEALKVELKSAVNVELEHSKTEVHMIVDNMKGALQTLVDDKVTPLSRNLETKLNSRYNSLNNDILRLSIYRHEQERLSWNEQKVYVNALSSSLNIINTSITLNDEWLLATGIDNLLEDLNSILKKECNVYPDAELIRNTVIALDKLPSEHALSVKSSKEKISQISAVA
ncbi:insecticidal delta-endotoxin Cry8Ea1 family protein [Vibrio sp. 10N.261.55.F4]|uniref:insecticidal delta-endotoxin Cry8Ea1 family protein n=1 Tax=unclassified Vibrio TaxID=2614977 RepID=UPI00355213F8